MLVSYKRRKKKDLVKGPLLTQAPNRSRYPMAVFPTILSVPPKMYLSGCPSMQKAMKGARFWK